MNEITPLPPNAQPFQTASNGRQPGGRFGRGNKAAQGNGQTRKVARFRTAMFAAVKAGDIRAIVGTLVEQAKAGEGWAVKLALEYLCGPPRDLDLDERLTTLEEAILGGNKS